jgi:hypothetical protein
MLGLLSGAPTLNLELGTAQPYALTIELGGGECRLALGGLPLTRIVVKGGGGRLTLDFGSPNPQTMRLLQVGAGAGDIHASHLANSGCAEMIFDGGAGAYALDFSGALRGDTHVRVATGVSSVELRVPATTAARVASESLLCPVDLGQGWTKQEGAYWNATGQAGSHPLLRIGTSVALGSLRLRSV